MIKLSDLELEAKKVTHHAVVHLRQDLAVCDVCDWSIGWNLNPDIVEKYFRQHQIESGHSITYSVQLIDQQDFEYVIEAE